MTTETDWLLEILRLGAQFAVPIVSAAVAAWWINRKNQERQASLDGDLRALQHSFDQKLEIHKTGLSRELVAYQTRISTAYVRRIEAHEQLFAHMFTGVF